MKELLTNLIVLVHLVSKGSSAMLLKADSKRRRSKAEIQAAKEAEIRRLQEALENEREIQRLKDQLVIVKAEAENHQSSSDVLNELMRLGKAKINEKGEFQLI